MFIIILGIICINLFAYLTIKLRPKIFKVDLFKPMILNFKLSILPNIILLATLIFILFLSYLNSLHTNTILHILSSFLTILGFIAWILLLPNSGYLVTELNMTHREQDKKPVALWYDIISVLSFAISGIVNTVLGINIFKIIILIYFDPDQVGRLYKISFIFLEILINLLVSIGIYLGRNIRFNSWDILRPFKFISKLIAHFKEENKFKNFAMFVLLHTIFFLIMGRLFAFNTDKFLKYK